MEDNKEQAAVNALLAEYTKAILELKEVVTPISPEALSTIADPLTKDQNCRSVQTILAHVVNSGYSYAVYIRKLKGLNGERPARALRVSAGEYSSDLDKVLQFTCETFSNIYDHELEEFDNAKKIKTSWGNWYDIEQLMEHAIVHILRHRRQIQKFI